MAKNMQPVLKRCRTLGVSPAAMGYSKTSNKNPGGQRRAKKCLQVFRTLSDWNIFGIFCNIRPVFHHLKSVNHTRKLFAVAVFGSM